MIYLNSEVYLGHFVKGERSGRAIFLDYKYNKLIAIWKDNERNGFSKIFTRSGEKVYEGLLKQGKYDSVGKLFHNGICIYEGYFLNGEKTIGTEFSDKKLSLGMKLYTGIFENNERFGLGKIYDPKFKVEHYGEISKDNVCWGKFYANMSTKTIRWGQNINSGEATKNNWRVEATSKCILTGYCLPENKLSFHVEKVYAILKELFGFFEFLSFFNNDMYLGEIGFMLPCGVGILHRHSESSVEVGSFLCDQSGGEFPNEIRK